MSRQAAEAVAVRAALDVCRRIPDNRLHAQVHVKVTADGTSIQARLSSAFLWGCTTIGVFSVVGIPTTRSTSLLCALLYQGQTITLTTASTRVSN
jgi:hypothetical protein